MSHVTHVNESGAGGEGRSHCTNSKFTEGYEAVNHEKVVAACHILLQRIAACCSVLQCVEVIANSKFTKVYESINYEKVWCSVMQPIAACCSPLRCVELIARTPSLQKGMNLSTMKRCDAVCCSVMQCVAMCCSVLQHAGVCQAQYDDSRLTKGCESVNYEQNCCNMIQCRCSVFYCSVLQRVAARCNVLQRVVVCWAHYAKYKLTKGCESVNYEKVFCSVLQHVAAYWAHCANCTFTKGCEPVNYKKVWCSFVFTAHTHIHAQFFFNLRVFIKE